MFSTTLGIQTYTQGYMLSFAFILFLGTLASFLFLINSKENINRSFGVIILSTSLWGLFRTIYYFFIENDFYFTDYFFHLSVAIMPFIIFSLISFVFTFFRTYVREIKNYYVYKTANYYVASALILLVILDTFFNTQFIITKNATEPGPLMFLIIFYFISTVIISGILFYESIEKHKTIGRKQFILISVPIIIIFLLAGTMFSDWYGFFIPPIYTVVTTFLLSITLFFSIFKSDTFSIKLVLSQIFVFAMWITIFIRMLLEESTSQIIMDIFLLLATMILGIQVIRKINLNTKNKRDLEQATHKLRKLNMELEEKVTSRTNILDKILTHTDTLIEELPIGIIEFNSNFKLLRINHTAENILGAPKNQVLNEIIEPGKIGIKGYQSLVEITFPLLSDNIVKIQNNTETNTNIHEAQIKYPIKKDIHITTLPFITKYGAKEEGLIKIIRDITREKNIDRSKNKFISIAAHKMRTPLSGVKWALKFVLDEDAGALNKRQKEFLQKSYNTNETLIRLVNELLDVDRIEKGALEYDMRTNSILELVTEAKKNNAESAKSKHIKLSLKVPEKLIPPFVFDRSKILNAINHLISNGIKYTHKNGSVELVLHQLTEQGTVIIDINDTGIGITDRQQEELFTKFYRSSEAMHMHTEGSGLGLLISKEIINKHSGKISLKQRKDSNGTRARIEIPINNKIKAN